MEDGAAADGQFLRDGADCVITGPDLQWVGPGRTKGALLEVTARVESGHRDPIANVDQPLQRFDPVEVVALLRRVELPGRSTFDVP